MVVVVRKKGGREGRKYRHGGRGRSNQEKITEIESSHFEPPPTLLLHGSTIENSSLHAFNRFYPCQKGPHHKKPKGESVCRNSAHAHARKKKWRQYDTPPEPPPCPHTHLMATWNVRPTTLQTRQAACANAQLHRAAPSAHPPVAVALPPAPRPFPLPFFFPPPPPRLSLDLTALSVGGGGGGAGELSDLLLLEAAPPAAVATPATVDAAAADAAAAAVAGAVASSMQTLMRSTTLRKMSASRDSR